MDEIDKIIAELEEAESNEVMDALVDAILIAPLQQHRQLREGDLVEVPEYYRSAGRCVVVETNRHLNNEDYFVIVRNIENHETDTFCLDIATGENVLVPGMKLARVEDQHE